MDAWVKVFDDWFCCSSVHLSVIHAQPSAAYNLLSVIPGQLNLPAAVNDCNDLGQVRGL